MKEIELTDGTFALVDTDFFTKYGHLSWFVMKTGYVQYTKGRSPKRKRCYMHRLAMCAMKGHPEIDHINRNKRDNRRQNLRFVSRGENQQGTYRNSNEWIGVTFRGNYKKKFNARLNRVDLGRFDSLQEAKDAYDKAAVEKYGPKAKTNRGIQ